MGRAPCCDKANVKKGPWSPEEDAKLKSYIEQHGTGGNWIALPQKIGLKRCGKSCRLRWLNYLRPNIKHGGFSEEEDNIICSLYISIGSRWSIIAAQLPGRTDNDIKNYWNTRLKKKLLGKQRKDQTQARRVCGMKQEASKREEGGNLAAAPGDGGIRSTYWPEPAAALPMYQNGGLPSHRTDAGDEHTSFRKMLLKLGGRFSGDNGASQPSPFLIPSSLPPPQPSYHDSASLVSPSVQANSYGTAEGLQGPNGFPSTELDEIFRGNSVKLEGLTLDYCFYGSGGVIGESTGTSSAESMNWPEVSPLAYPSMGHQSYQGMQPCLFEEPVHLGMQ